MKIPQAMAMASALLLAAGCAHEQQNAQYDESLSPAYSSGQANEYGDRGNGMSSPSSSVAYSAGANGSVAAGKTDSESDNTIVAAVRESLRRNAEIAPIVPNIQIMANNGAVVLDGSVQSEEQKRQIGALAQQAMGVVAVNNQLEVISNPAPREPVGQNESSNPLLNPTSSNSNSLPKLYKNAGGSMENSSSNALNPASPPGMADKIYQGESQNTNSNQMR